MKRKSDSRKGQNGKVMIIGGSSVFHGAPILSALGAEYSGADLIIPFVPPCHAQTTRGYSLNFIVHTFAKDHLTTKDVKQIIKMSGYADAIVIGPGLGKEKETIKAVKQILMSVEKPTVIDADALIFTNTLPKITVLTPHRGEFMELTGDEPTQKNIQKWAKHLNAVILVKSHEDIIADRDKLIINKTGNAFMTVGGTGDVLCGVIGGLIAQGNTPIDSCVTATYALGKAAEKLAKHQSGIRAKELAEMLPKMLK